MKAQLFCKLVLEPKEGEDPQEPAEFTALVDVPEPLDAQLREIVQGLAQFKGELNPNHEQMLRQVLMGFGFSAGPLRASFAPGKKRRL